MSWKFTGSPQLGQGVAFAVGVVMFAAFINKT
jgi:transketolase